MFILILLLPQGEYIWFEKLIGTNIDSGCLGWRPKKITAEFGPCLWPLGTMKTAQAQTQESVPLIPYKLKLNLHWGIKSTHESMCGQNHSDL